LVGAAAAGETGGGAAAMARMLRSIMIEEVVVGLKE
jgi:hypothetical protein